MLEQMREIAIATYESVLKRMSVEGLRIVYRDDTGDTTSTEGVEKEHLIRKILEHSYTKQDVDEYYA